MNVQAYILNISAIQSIDELREMADNEYMHTVEMPLFDCGITSFTAPTWIMQGDIVFFYHASTAKQHNKRLRKEIKNENYDDEDELNKYLDYCERLYNKYGGKIYAVGKVNASPYYSDSGWEHPHFKSRIFAPINDVVELHYPVLAKEFSEFLPITRHSGITAILGNDFEKLKNLILRYNKVDYLKKCSAVSVPLREVKRGNWLQSANENNRKYLFEMQFRKHYTDYLLLYLSDDNKIFSEVSCFKNKKLSGYVDNCIKFNGKYLFVEIKINMFVPDDVTKQVEKYCNTDSAKVGGKNISAVEIYNNSVLIIDTQRICLYNSLQKESMLEIALLNDIKSITDVRKLRNVLGKVLE